MSLQLLLIQPDWSFIPLIRSTLPIWTTFLSLRRNFIAQRISWVVFLCKHAVNVMSLFFHFSKYSQQKILMESHTSWGKCVCLCKVLSEHRNVETTVTCLPLVPLLVGSVSRRSLWLERLNRRWMRPRRRTLSSLSEEGMERLRSSSMERSESESESSPKGAEGGDRGKE